MRSPRAPRAPRTDPVDEPQGRGVYTVSSAWSCTSARIERRNTGLTLESDHPLGG
jgi:hypothetical protein